MSKYDPLEDYLKQSDDEQIAMGFSEIETVLGFNLPPSSRKQRAWWSNNPTNNVMTQAWLDAGFETAAVDIPAERLMFKRIRQAAAVTSSAPRRSPLFGALKGMMTIPPDLDLTLPADPDWGKAVHD
ncbi:hypothetical protein ABAC460_04145 [Asticcacaulis sp. AC460]|uniref:DUF7662 domain-containing protein n=1 Tax=Asticcacaulis sp. AC460 TaxID=1282360 RepID=UPI0003C3D3FF|nr:hypothetical protein [Asticcacaulis sp. AC460]ESQ92085.1 hypothetical protein ABAC460_04145 [Asticcacaulis sp. AC460]